MQERDLNTHQCKVSHLQIAEINIFAYPQTRTGKMKLMLPPTSDTISSQNRLTTINKTMSSTAEMGVPHFYKSIFFINQFLFHEPVQHWYCHYHQYQFSVSIYDNHKAVPEVVFIYCLQINFLVININTTSNINININKPK